MLRLRGMLGIILTGIMTEISEGDYFFCCIYSSRDDLPNGQRFLTALQLIITSAADY